MSFSINRQALTLTGIIRVITAPGLAPDQIGFRGRPFESVADPVHDSAD